MSRNVKWRREKAAYYTIQGHSQQEIAKLLNARPETVSRWKKHDDFIYEYERLRADICEDMRTKLWQFATATFEDILAIQSSGDPQMRLKNALKFFEVLRMHRIFEPGRITNYSPEL